MKRINSKSLRVFFVTVFAIAVGFFGCQTQSPLQPKQDQKIMRATGELTFLTSKVQRLNKAFSLEQLITASAGGTMVSGDEASGYSSLFFKPGDLSQDTTIVFNWDSQGYLTDLYPHGIVFNSPVQIYLSYKDADLSQVNEDSLRIWYYDENENSWERIGGTVNKTEKRVEGFIEHFSRYAVAAE